jgi:hypothetical protein
VGRDWDACGQRLDNCRIEPEVADGAGLKGATMASIGCVPSNPKAEIACHSGSRSWRGD